MEIINMGGQISVADFGQFSLGVYSEVENITPCYIALILELKEYIKEDREIENREIIKKDNKNKYKLRPVIYQFLKASGSIEILSSNLDASFKYFSTNELTKNGIIRASVFLLEKEEYISLNSFIADRRPAGLVDFIR